MTESGYLYPILLARQEHLLSLFIADSLEAVCVGNAAAALDLRGGWMASPLALQLPAVLPGS